MSLAIVTSRTRRMYLKRPSGSFVLNAGDPQAQGLQYWWPCNTHGDRRTSGSAIIRDMLGRSDGVGGTSSTLVPDDLFGNVIYLDPTVGTDYTFVFTLGTCPLISGQDFTFSFWARRTTSAQGRWMGVAGSSCAMSWWNDDNIYYDTPRINATTSPYATNHWNHFVFQSKGSQAKSAIYLNGKKIAESTTAAFATITSGGGDFTFGRRNNSAGGGSDTAAPGTTGVGYGCDIRMYCPSLPDAVVPEMYHPATRWSLYYQAGRKAISLPGITPGGKLLLRLQNEGLFVGSIS